MISIITGCGILKECEKKNIDACPYCGAKLLIKNTVTTTLELVCPGCGFTVEDKSGRKVEPAKTCSNCSSCSDCP